MKRRLLRVLAAVIGTVAIAIVVLVVDGWRAFGARASGARKVRMITSPEWGGDRFVNPQPLINDFWRGLRDARTVSADVTPHSPVNVVTVARSHFATPPASGLRVTWFGHSSTLVEIDGVRVLTDPVWGQRVSPIGFLGPQRWNPPLIALDSLPPIDAVVISHDHYDHLDYATIVAMRAWTNVFIVPLGIGAHLEAWGIPTSRIVELDWWQRTTVRNVTIVSTPARHASGRILLDNDAKLWTGFALLSPQHRVYYSGDSGLFPALADIGAQLGPFDLTMIEVGQYGQAWPDWHMGPEQAVLAHQMVRGRVMLPVHWGLFALAYHAWTEPIERAIIAAKAADVTLVTPRPGESVEPSAPPTISQWWPTLPFKGAGDDPIVSSRMSPETPQREIRAK